MALHLYSTGRGFPVHAKRCSRVEIFFLVGDFAAQNVQLSVLRRVGFAIPYEALEPQPGFFL